MVLMSRLLGAKFRVPMARVSGARVIIFMGSVVR